MRNIILVILILLPLQGSSVFTGREKTVSIVLPAAYSRSSLSDFQQMLSEDWCDFYKYSETHDYYLQKATVFVTIDEYNECWQDSTVGVYSTRSSLFLIRGLKPRKQAVKSVSLPIESVLAGEEQSFYFNGKTYTFRAEGVMKNGEVPDTAKYDKNQWDEIKDYKLYFSEQKSRKEQLVTAVPEFMGTRLKILWVGDLDEDGKPDFLLDTSDFYETTKVELFLSSLAERKDLVKSAAEAMYSYDC